ncbi:hypothetical protein QW131_14710 [Roseibium salinum]|nr:hypothetical protein [Roseibium salinum]
MTQANHTMDLHEHFQFLGHYYITGEIIAQAPRSKLELYIIPPEEGSFKQTVIAGALGAIVAAPFTTFVSKTVENWIPSGDPQIERLIEALEENNDLLRERNGVLHKSDEEVRQESEVEQHLEQHNDKMQVLRSITSNSFRSVFRPIGRSAEYVNLLAGPFEEPIGVVDAHVLSRIEADRIDDEDSILVGIVNSFSRSSKTGVIFF